MVSFPNHSKHTSGGGIRALVTSAQLSNSKLPFPLLILASTEILPTTYGLCLPREHKDPSPCTLEKFITIPVTLALPLPG